MQFYYRVSVPARPIITVSPFEHLGVPFLICTQVVSMTKGDAVTHAAAPRRLAQATPMMPSGMGSTVGWPLSRQSRFRAPWVEHDVPDRPAGGESWVAKRRRSVLGVVVANAILHLARAWPSIGGPPHHDVKMSETGCNRTVTVSALAGWDTTARRTTERLVHGRHHAM